MPIHRTKFEGGSNSREVSSFSHSLGRSVFAAIDHRNVERLDVAVTEVFRPLSGYRNPVAATLAVVLVIQVPTAYLEAVPIDDGLLAFGTVGVLIRIARNISDVNII